jgi:hypothetical protein
MRDGTESNLVPDKAVEMVCRSWFEAVPSALNNRMSSGMTLLSRLLVFKTTDVLAGREYAEVLRLKDLLNALALLPRLD